jgi:hypothetical protein
MYISRQSYFGARGNAIFLKAQGNNKKHALSGEARTAVL